VPLLIVDSLLLNDIVSRAESVGTEKGYGLDGRNSIPGRGKSFSYSNLQTCSGAYPASYSMGVRGSFLEGKAPRSRIDELYHPLPPQCLNGIMLNYVVEQPALFLPFQGQWLFPLQ
jgi:hypothetical protein